MTEQELLETIAELTRELSFLSAGIDPDTEEPIEFEELFEELPEVEEDEPD